MYGFACPRIRRRQKIGRSFEMLLGLWGYPGCFARRIAVTLMRASSSRPMTELGIAITLATVLVLAVVFLRHRRSPLPLRGWIGVTLLVTAEALMFGQVWPVSAYPADSTMQGRTLLCAL